MAGQAVSICRSPRGIVAVQLHPIRGSGKEFLRVLLTLTPCLDLVQHWT